MANILPTKQSSPHTALAYLPTNPMIIPNVVETILKHFTLDFDQLQELRLVNRVWRDEATRLVLKIGYICLPPNHWEKSVKARRIGREALRSLLQTSIGSTSSPTPTPRFPINFHIQSSKDLNFFKTFYLKTAPTIAETTGCERNPRDSLTSLKLDCDEDLKLDLALLEQILKAFPNLQEFHSPALDEMICSKDRKIWRILGEYGRGSLIRKLTFDLRVFDEDFEGNDQETVETWIKTLEKLVDTMQLEELWADLGGAEKYEIRCPYKDIAFESRVETLLHKILMRSQKSLEILRVGPQNRLNCLDLPTLIFPKVKKIQIPAYDNNSDGDGDQQEYHLGPSFPKGVTFQKNFPNLRKIELGLSIKENPLDPRVLLPPKEVGVSENVVAMTILGYVADMSGFAKMLPNLKILSLGNFPDFCLAGRSIWTHLKGLQYLDVHLLCTNWASFFPYFDSIVCGFNPRFVQHLDQTGTIMPSSEVPNEFPSINDLKDLKLFTLHFSCIRMDEIPSGFKIVSPVLFHYLKKSLKVRIKVSTRDQSHKLAIQESFKPMKKWCEVVVESRV